MLHYAGVFLVIALLAALFGFTGIAAGAVEIARVLFFVFIVLFVVFRRRLHGTSGVLCTSACASPSHPGVSVSISSTY